MAQSLKLRLQAINLKSARNAAGTVGACALVFAGQAHAELPAAVATAIDAYKTDATTAVGLIMGAGVVIWGLMKLASKLGWR